MFDVHWAELAVSVLIQIILIAVVFGRVTQKQDDQNKRIEKVELELADVRQKMSEDYVQYRHFDQVVKPILDALTELRSDVKTLISRVAESKKE